MGSRTSNTEKQDAGTKLEGSTGVWVETDSSGEALDTEDAELGEGALLDAVNASFQIGFAPACEAPTGGDHSGCTAADEDQCLATQTDGETCEWRTRRARSFGDSVVHNAETYLLQDKQARAQKRTAAAL